MDQAGIKAAFICAMTHMSGVTFVGIPRFNFWSNKTCLKWYKKSTFYKSVHILLLSTFKIKISYTSTVEVESTHVVID